MTGEQTIHTAEAARVTVADQLAETRASNAALRAHIAAVHEVVDQLIDHVNRELGIDWRPDLRSARSNPADVEAISQPAATEEAEPHRARRAERYQEPQP